MRRDRLAGLLLGLGHCWALLPVLPAVAQETSPTREMMGRAQYEAQRRNGEELLERIEGSAQTIPFEAAPVAAAMPSPPDLGAVNRGKPAAKPREPASAKDAAK